MKAPSPCRILVCLAVALASSAQEKPAAEFQALQQQFDAKVKLEVQQPYDLAVVDLNVKYTAALDRALQSAQQAGKLEDAVAIKSEREAVALGKGVPATDDEKTPPVMKQLHETYRSALDRIVADRAKRLQPLQVALARSLEALATSLTKEGKLEEAMAVKKHREALAAADQVPAPTSLGQPAATGLQTTGATKDAPFVNSLGMKFVPVSGTKILMCMHETRKADFAAYAAANPAVSGSWKGATYNGVFVGDGDDHPVVNVTWDDATGFCAWLGKKEGRIYRLPTDSEWSDAAGLKEPSKSSGPESLAGKIKDEFPWGKKWPPPKSEENIADTMWKEKFPNQSSVDGYTDGFATTAPVMSLTPNKLGLYDLGGNVWEWCQDWYNESKLERVARGGCWGIHDSNFELSSFRSHFKPDRHDVFGGFRCVVEK